MQQGIHPDYHPVEVTCSCGNTFVTRTAGKEDHMFVDVCSSDLGNQDGYPAAFYVSYGFGGPGSSCPYGKT